MRSKLRVRHRAVSKQRRMALGKKGERPPIFKLEWKFTGLSHALQVLKVQWWSFDQAAKINEMSMKSQ